jgi:hypothetical protein
MIDMNHEPETKSTNKARNLQDMMIRAINAGCENPASVTRFTIDWFIDDAARDVQAETLEYAIAHLWTTVTTKMGIVPIKKSRVTKERRAVILGEERSKIHRDWLDHIIPMTGAQLRVARLLPEEMACKVGEDQRVGEVFTVDELRAVYRKIAKKREV